MMQKSQGGKFKAAIYIYQLLVLWWHWKKQFQWNMSSGSHFTAGWRVKKWWGNGKKSVHIFFKCFTVKRKKKSVAVGQRGLVEDFKNCHCCQWWYCSLSISRYFRANRRWDPFYENRKCGCWCCSVLRCHRKLKEISLSLWHKRQRHLKRIMRKLDRWEV